MLPGTSVKNPRQHSVIILPSCTAWKGLFPSTNSTEMVIFSVSKISLFKLRSATARRNTSSSFLADSSKMAPINEGRKQKEKDETITQYMGTWNGKKKDRDKNTVTQRLEPQMYVEHKGEISGSTFNDLQ